MSKLLPRLSRLVTVRPYVTILVLIAITVALGAGAVAARAATGNRVDSTNGERGSRSPLMRSTGSSETPAKRA